MNAFKFAAYPSNNAIASGVTLLVSAWFLVAAGAILADPASPYTQRDAKAASPIKTAGTDRAAPVTTARMEEGLQPASLVVPAVRYTITVQARRTAA
ncbi:MAG TPA: hypothetical protein VLT89_06625 [Usitatibacter sp.]|nr:hypothetical protein [Usitatibacter sp.]